MNIYRMTSDGFHRLIRYRGIFDFDGLYKFLVKWIKNKDFDFYETRVMDKPPYKIHKLMGRKKINFMVMFVIHTELWLWEAKPVQVIKNGKTKTLTEARMKIMISGDIIWDYDGDFEKSQGLKKMENFLNNKILYHENLLKYIDYFDYYLHDYMTEIKKYLEMETASNAY